jgi:hypothetical protein
VALLPRHHPMISLNFSIVENDVHMFNSPVESYNAHYKIDIDLGFLLTAAHNTYEAIVAIEMEDLGVARQKWESVDGEKLLDLWNVGIVNFKLKEKVWDEIEKPMLDEPIAKPVSQFLAKKVYKRDGHICRYCNMPVFTRFKGSPIHQLIEAFPDQTPGLTLVNGSLYGSGKSGGIKNVDYAKFLWGLAAPDHVVPRSHGGQTGLDNLVTSCSGCNYSKMDLTLEQMNVHPPKTLP